MLALVEKLTRTPEAVTPHDVVAVRAAGVDDDRIRQGIYLCGLMNTMNRVSRPLDFDPVSEDRYPRVANTLLRHGYRVPPPAPWRRARAPRVPRT